MKNKIISALPLLMIMVMAAMGLALARASNQPPAAPPPTGAAEAEPPGVAGTPTPGTDGTGQIGVEGTPTPSTDEAGQPDAEGTAAAEGEDAADRIVVSYPLGLLAGIFIGYPLGQAMAGFSRGNRRWRWVAMTVLMVHVFAVSIVWGPHAILAAFPTLILTFIFTAIMLRELYNGDVMKTIGQHLRLTFGYFKGFQIVNHGKMIVPTEKEPIFGPRIFVVRPGNAVVTINRNKHTVYGPGFYDTANFEYIEKIFDLSPHERSWRIQNILTSDRIPVQARVEATYSIDINRLFAYNDQDFTDNERNRILILHRELADWQALAVDMVEQTLRDIINVRRFEALVQPNLHQRLAREVLAAVTQQLRARGWPIRIDHIVIKDLQPAQEMLTAMGDRWNEVQRAAAWRTILDAIARGYANARALGMTEAELQAEVLRYTLEQIAKDPTTSIMFNRELNELMALLRPH